MIAAVVAAALVGGLVVVAGWDAVRRALASQDRRAELRVEALRREDYERLEARMTQLEAENNRIGREMTFKGGRR